MVKFKTILAVFLATLAFNSAITASNGEGEQILYPGTAAMVQKSTDVDVVKVIGTSPERAIEGGRDTAHLRVVRAIKGDMAVGKVFPLYYHLFWNEAGVYGDAPVRFVSGQQYIVFLRSQQEQIIGVPIGDGANFGDVLGNPANGMFLTWHLTDEWLGISTDYDYLEGDIQQIMKGAAMTDITGGLNGAVTPPKTLSDMNVKREYDIDRVILRDKHPHQAVWMIRGLSDVAYSSLASDEVRYWVMSLPPGSTIVLKVAVDDLNKPGADNAGLEDLQNFLKFLYTTKCEFVQSPD